MIECAELIAADVFTAAEQTRQRLTFGDVQLPPGPAGQPSPTVAVGAVASCGG